MNERFNFRVAIRQKDGSYKRYNAHCVGWDARGLYARCAIPKNDNTFLVEDIVIDGENAILEQCTDNFFEKKTKIIGNIHEVKE